MPGGTASPPIQSAGQICVMSLVTKYPLTHRRIERIERFSADAAVLDAPEPVFSKRAAEGVAVYHPRLQGVRHLRSGLQQVREHTYENSPPGRL